MLCSAPLLFELFDVLTIVPGLEDYRLGNTAGADGRN
jgi:hypothetical protein